MKYQIISERTSKKDYSISDASDAYSALSRYVSKSKEHFFVLTLDAKHSVIRTLIISIGLVNKTIVHPREVFRPAIKDNACAIIIAHNHPSGSLDPSHEDKELTTRLVKAGELLGIPVLDQLIISKKGYLSFLESNLLI